MITRKAKEKDSEKIRILIKKPAVFEGPPKSPQ